MESGARLEEVARVLRSHLAGTGAEYGELSLEDIAAVLGISRSTLIRRIGHRRHLDEILARHGAGTSRRSAGDRAVRAAARLYGELGVGEVTLEMVAAEAGCTVQAIQGQLGGRDGLLAAVFDRYSPMPGVAEVLAEPPADLERGARLLYAQVLDALLGEGRVMAAMFAEIASRPAGALAAHVRQRYAPRFAGLMTGWLRGYVDSGVVRDLPDKTLLSQFAGPVLARSVAALATGERLTAAARAQLAADLAAAFCRAVRA
ncbi:TetR/AcrR family transcriptional regulator [Actinomadura sp. ATCC 31491]|uniref:TetR/AcrR family transcriptional regulator n=1 Tax=Actinomadura luzonensis TaxID=2805427 RepID=A0ABT0FVD3_9ACTN|nr:TetR/AcrR family transcriptional regulator [Actinomadura luzonensis]MCK2216277.1 TetR/AcrR family transcriptional regulator [Actinomadura luzonensis]